MFVSVLPLRGTFGVVRDSFPNRRKQDKGTILSTSEHRFFCTGPRLLLRSAGAGWLPYFDERRNSGPLFGYAIELPAGTRRFLESKRPLLPQNPLEREGGLAPHLVQWVLRSEGAVWTPKADDFWPGVT